MASEQNNKSIWPSWEIRYQVWNFAQILILMRVLSEEKCQQQKSGEQKNFGVEKYDVFL